MEYTWLYDYRHGIALREIATRARVSVSRVKFGVERAKAMEGKLCEDEVTESLKPGRQDDMGLRLIPLFPIGAFTPQSACPHGDPMKRGTKLCCMVCHASGMDDHPGLRRDPRTDPAPEPKPAPRVAATGSRPSRKPKETRKQRRRRRFAEAAVA